MRQANPEQKKKEADTKQYQGHIPPPPMLAPPKTYEPNSNVIGNVGQSIVTPTVGATYVLQPDVCAYPVVAKPA